MRIAVCVFASIALAGCGAEETSTAPAKPPPVKAAAQNRPKPKPGTRIALMKSDYGTILAGPKRRAIYLFTREGGAKPRCYGECAKAWPPVLSKGKPKAAAGVDGAELGTTKRSDGKRQVTYNGHPLYYWYGDPPGKVLCQDVEEFGGHWYVVDPAGDAITG
jgi:predicted lipoprotein with Yx(FWY)xxD motif